MFKRIALFPLIFMLALTTGHSMANPTFSNQQAGEGLKALLQQGSELAIEQLGRSGGFGKDSPWRIPLPKAVQKPAQLMRNMGQDALVDSLEDSLNTAAEQAVPHAKELLVDSIRQISLQDASQILSGDSTSATQYLERSNREALRERFLPIVKQTTDGTPLIQQYNQVAGQLGSLSSSRKKIPSVEDYVADQTLDALFAAIAEQESRLRANPGQAAGQLLKGILEKL